jgi:hypothetical protein
MAESFPACRHADLFEVFFRSNTAIGYDRLSNLGQGVYSRTALLFGTNHFR